MFCCPRVSPTWATGLSWLHLKVSGAFRPLRGPSMLRPTFSGRHTISDVTGRSSNSWAVDQPSGRDHQARLQTQLRRGSRVGLCHRCDRSGPLSRREEAPRTSTGSRQVSWTQSNRRRLHLFSPLEVELSFCRRSN